MNIRTAKEDFCPLQILEGNLWKGSTLERTMLRSSPRISFQNVPPTKGRTNVSRKKCLLYLETRFYIYVCAPNIMVLFEG